MGPLSIALRQQLWCGVIIIDMRALFLEARFAASDHILFDQSVQT